jgi:uncharacterized protein (TIGR03437 family)
MHRALPLLAALACGLPLCAQGTPGSTSPAYAAASIVNSATFMPGPLAPNAIGTIYGTNLSFDTTSVPGSPSGVLPDELAGVHVYVGGLAASLYYVSPQQINFLTPAGLRPGTVDCFVARDGTSGPHVPVTLDTTALALYQSQPGLISSIHANGSAITKSNPAQPGETVVIYGTGWGQTTPNAVNGEITTVPSPLAGLKDFHVLVNGARLPATTILYAGSAPEWPGLYQVTFKLPKSVTPNPELHIAIGDQASPAGLRLPVQ